MDFQRIFQHIVFQKNNFKLFSGKLYYSRKQIVEKAKSEIIPWAIKNITGDGFWPHDRFENQPGALKVIDKSRMGVYTWGLLLGLELFSKLTGPIKGIEETIEKSYAYMRGSLVPGDIHKWGHHCWATTAIAAKLYPKYFFPMGVGMPEAKAT